MMSFDIATGTLEAAATITWDAIVIGAGPAGAPAARLLALGGLQTLAVDAKMFPRDKVCGGYVNERALTALERVGLLSRVLDCSTPVRQLEVVRGRQRLRVPLLRGRLTNRAAFDTTLLDATASAGVTIITGAQAVVQPAMAGDCRILSLTQESERVQVRARVVICADGLARSSVRLLPEFTTAVEPASRVGIGAIVASEAADYEFGKITMVVSRRGYVGIARTNQRELNVAAAIAPGELAKCGPAAAVADILRESALPELAEISAATWRGTPPVTSKPKCLAGERIFLIGDASGYVEPFTGEGIAAAVESAIAVASLAIQGVYTWNNSLASRWAALHRQIVSDRQTTSRRLAWTLRRPWAAAIALTACQLHPRLAARIIASTGSPTQGVSLTHRGAV